MQPVPNEGVTAMNVLQTVLRGSVAAIFVLLAAVESAWTQAVQPTAPSPMTPPGPVPEGGAERGLVAFAVVVGLLAITGIAVKIYDMKRKREDEGVALQARLSDALLIEPSLAGYPITPTVHVPFRRSSPVVVTITGAVSTPELRAAALQLVSRELSHVGTDYRIDDHLAVDALVAKHAA
jgi:hypothetical protein